MKTERCLSMTVVHGTSYIELRECWLLGMSSSRVSVLKFLTCDVKEIYHSINCGHHHPFNTSSPDKITYPLDSTDRKSVESSG